MMPTTLETTKEMDGVQEAVAEMQESGLDVTLETGGRSATMVSAQTTVQRIATRAEILEWPEPATDPWPHVEGEPEEYLASANAQEIGEDLIRNVRRLEHLARFRIHYVLRNKKWEKKGKTVFGEMKRPTGLLKSYAEADFIVLLNWEVWQQLNPMQRVALVYHELRHGDSEGKTRGHDFEGFFDELAIFGTRTYEDWNRLASAARQGVDVTHQYSLSILDEG